MTREGQTKLGLLAAICLALFGSTTSASAAGTYVAAPGGSGTTCSDSLPCTVYQARNSAVSDPGSTILLKPGTYNLNAPGGTLGLSGTFTMMPAVAGTRPELKSTDASNIQISSAGVTIQDLRIDVSGLGGSGRALDFQAAGTAKRVDVVAAGTSPIGVLVKNGATLTDSTVWNQSNNGTAIIGGGSGGTVRNVTAIASGTPNSVGINANGSFGPNPQVLTVENSIARGSSQDLAASGGTSSGAVVLNVQNSDYGPVFTNAPNAVINDLGGHITDAPSFVNAAGGDFHQLAGSPTIERGAVLAGLSSLDFDGGPRVVNSGSTCTGLPDIGADEFATDTTPASCHPPAPPAAATPSAKHKCKKKHKKRAAVAKKKCKKKKKRR
jgi:hypothetical protein